MDWGLLLSEDRERESQSRGGHRNEFDKDYDRIISSSSLRRLQDKAQVFPLQRNDFTRTRLTHSLEVSAIGRSLGLSISKELIAREKNITQEQADKIPSLLAVTSLVHDIGNPPFGHFGEDIIQEWFTDWFKDGGAYEKVVVEFGQELNLLQINDLKFFEGNAQALRVLSKLQFLNDCHGANFTYASLACLLKYPRSSGEGNIKDGDKKSFEKFGYFQSEKELFDRIVQKTGIGDNRHPLTFLMEAADDIAYSAADIEDAVKKGVVDWELLYPKLKEKFGEIYPDGFSKLEGFRQVAEENEVPDRHLIAVQNFRVWAQGVMIQAVVECFIERYDDIMDGEFDKELIKESSAAELHKELSKIAVDYVYKCNEVLTLEMLGHRVISGLLDLFVDALANNQDFKKAKKKHGKLYHLISPNFRHVHLLNNEGTKRTLDDVTLYDKLQLVTDFISGMTDSYALELYQKLYGVKL